MQRIIKYQILKDLNYADILVINDCSKNNTSSGNTVGIERKSKDDSDSFENAKKLVYEYAKDNGSISRTEVEEITGFRRTKAYRLIKEMCDTGTLELQSSGRLTVYLAK